MNWERPVEPNLFQNEEHYNVPFQVENNRLVKTTEKSGTADPRNWRSSEWILPSPLRFLQRISLLVAEKTYKSVSEVCQIPTFFTS
jgi:hypothetical protein